MVLVAKQFQSGFYTLFYGKGLKMAVAYKKDDKYDMANLVLLDMTCYDKPGRPAAGWTGGSEAR